MYGVVAKIKANVKDFFVLRLSWGLSRGETANMANPLILRFMSPRCGRELLLSVLLAGLLLCPAALVHGAESPSLAIQVDQVGYPLNGPKVALVSSHATTF